MGDRPKCDCGLVLVRPSVGFQRPHNVGTVRQVLRSSCTREGRLHTNQTLLTLLPSRHNLSLRLFSQLLSPMCLLSADDVLPPSVKFLRGRRPGICISAGHQGPPAYERECVVSQTAVFIHPQPSAGCHTCKNRHPGKMSRKTSKLVLSHFVSLTFLTWLRVKDAGINSSNDESGRYIRT